jgi:hypothetical protein
MNGGWKMEGGRWIRVEISDLLVVGEVVDRGSDHAHIKDGAVCGVETGGKPVTEDGGVGACIETDGYDSVTSYLLTKMISDQLDGLFMKLFFEDAPDIVFTENGFRDGHKKP